jgi:hypothetical protein
MHRLHKCLASLSSFFSYGHYGFDSGQYANKVKRSPSDYKDVLKLYKEINGHCSITGIFPVNVVAEIRGSLLVV